MIHIPAVAATTAGINASLDIRREVTLYPHLLRDVSEASGPEMLPLTRGMSCTTQQKAKSYPLTSAQTLM